MKTAKSDQPLQPRLQPNALITRETAIVGKACEALVNALSFHMSAR